MDTSDLGFTYVVRQGGIVQIRHKRRLAATLRGRKAHAFLDDLAGAGDHEAQQLMARLTGNYKRGNERVAREHDRNRR